MRISDWSSDVCSSDLQMTGWSVNSPSSGRKTVIAVCASMPSPAASVTSMVSSTGVRIRSFSSPSYNLTRSEEHTSELQSLMRYSYAVFCLIKQTQHVTHQKNKQHSVTIQQHSY